MSLRSWQAWLPCLIFAGTVGAASSAGAQGPSVAAPAAPGVPHWSASTLVAYADSFVSSHGADSGWIADRFEPTATGYEFTQSFAYGPHQFRTSVVSLSPAMVVDSVRARGESRGLVLDLDVVYVGQHASGYYYRTDPDSLTKVPFETEMPDSAYDAAAQMALYPTFDMHVGMKRHLLEFDPIRGRTTSVIMTVVGKERITVPAGTFDTYRVEILQARSYVFLWFLRSSPHLPVKVMDPVSHWSTEMVTRAQ